jgi:hypothetical protein
VKCSRTIELITREIFPDRLGWLSSDAIVLLTYYAILMHGPCFQKGQFDINLFKIFLFEFSFASLLLLLGYLHLTILSCNQFLGRTSNTHESFPPLSYGNPEIGLKKEIIPCQKWSYLKFTNKPNKLLHKTGLSGCSLVEQ